MHTPDDSPGDAAPHDAGRRRALIGLGLASTWLGAAAADGAPAFAATMELDPERPGRPTNPRLLGSNTPWVYGSEGLMDETGRWVPAMLARAREWSPPLLRYPALPDTHHWRQGMGPLAERPPVFAYDGQPLQKIVFGTQEFLETCAALGAEPLIQVNVHDGDVDALARQAADWVATLKSRTLRARVGGRALAPGRLWELGNEPYLIDSRKADGRANALFLKPAAYARRASKVLAAMRAVDPGLRAGLPFALDTYSGRPWHRGGETATVVGEQLGFADKVLATFERPQDIGFLSLHYYMPLVALDPELDDAAPVPADAALYWGALAGTETLRRHLGLVDAFWRQHPRTAALPVPPLMVTEYNAFFTNARRHGQELPQNAYVMTLAGALFAADLVLMLATQPRVEAALQWSLSNDWVFGAIAADGGGGARPRPLFRAMLLLRRLLESGGQLLDTPVAVETTAQARRQVGFAAAVDELPLVSALATRHGTQLRVLTINKDPARSTDVRIRLRSRGLVRARVEALTASAPFAAPDTAAAAANADAAATLDDDGRGVSARLAPASLALWTLDLR